MVHSWFATSDDWDNQFEGHEHGWAAFFRILRLSLTYFRGQASSAFQLMGTAAAPTSKAWEALIGELGLSGAAEGQHVQSAASAPRLAGVVERLGPPEYPELLLRLDQPAPGIAHLFALPMGGNVFLPVRLYLYGDRASHTAVREEPVWQAWMNNQFPSASNAGAVAQEA